MVTTLAPGWGFAVNNVRRTGAGDGREMVDLATRVEELGFDSVWLADHLLWHTPIVDATALLGAFVGVTRRVTVGTSVYLLGLRQPGIAAKFFTSLASVAEGRLAIGVGVGGENPAEFEFAGVDHQARGRILDRAIDTLYAAWDAAGGAPRLAPVGDRPPLLVGGRSNATRRRIVRTGGGWLGAWVSPRRIADEASALAELGVGAAPIALNIYLRTGPSEPAARADAAAFLGEVYAMDPEPLMRYSVAGTPRSCAEQLASYAEAGVSHFVLRPAGWDQSAQLDAWSDELLPLLRGLSLEPGPELR